MASQHFPICIKNLDTVLDVRVSTGTKAYMQFMKDLNVEIERDLCEAFPILTLGSVGMILLTTVRLRCCYSIWIVKFDNKS